MAASETFLEVLQRKPVLGGARHGRLGGLSSRRVPLGPQMRVSETAAAPWATTRPPLGNFTGEAFSAEATAPSESIAARFVGLAPALGDASAFQTLSVPSDPPFELPSELPSELPGEATTVQAKPSERVRLQPISDQTINRFTSSVEKTSTADVSAELPAVTDTFSQPLPVSDSFSGPVIDEEPSIRRSVETLLPVDSRDESSTTVPVDQPLPSLVQRRPLTRPVPLGSSLPPLGNSLAENAIQQPESSVGSNIEAGRVPPVQAYTAETLGDETAVSSAPVSETPASETSIVRRAPRLPSGSEQLQVDSSNAESLPAEPGLSVLPESSTVQARVQSVDKASASEELASDVSAAEGANTEAVVSAEVASGETIQPSRLEYSANLPLSLAPGDSVTPPDTVQPSIAAPLPTESSSPDNFSSNSALPDSSIADNFSSDSAVSEKRLAFLPPQTPSLDSVQAQLQSSAELPAPTPTVSSAETPPVQHRVATETTQADSSDLALRPNADIAERVSPQTMAPHLARTEEAGSEAVAPESTPSQPPPSQLTQPIAPTPPIFDAPNVTSSVVSPKLAPSSSSDANPAPSILSPPAANIPISPSATIENISDIDLSTGADASTATASNVPVFPSIQRRKEDSSRHFSKPLMPPLGMRTPLVEETVTESIGSAESNSDEAVRARMDVPRAAAAGDTLPGDSSSKPDMHELTSKLMRRANRESAGVSLPASTIAADAIAWQTQFEQDTVRRQLPEVSPTVHLNSSFSTDSSAESTLGQTVDLFSSSALADSQGAEQRGDFSIDGAGERTPESDDMLETLADVIYAQLREHLYRLQECQQGYSPPLPLWSASWSPPATGASTVHLTKTKNLGNYHGPWPPKLHQLATDVRHQVESRLRQNI